jgi:hypothetical protein
MVILMAMANVVVMDKTHLSLVNQPDLSMQMMH